MAGLPSRTLAEEFLVAIRDGRLSVADAARWAEARVREGGADQAMTALGHCTGSSGERMLQAWVQKQPWRRVLPEAYSFRAPVAIEGGAAAAQGALHCLLPHEMLASIWKAAPKLFEELFGSPSDREAYWAEMARTARQMPEGPRGNEHHRWLRDHPARRVAPACRIPLGTHGDGGEMHGKEKITVQSWGGLCRRGSTVDTRLLFMVLKDSEEVGGRATLDRIFKVFAWSFAAMLDGRYPVEDEMGVPFGPEHHPERALLAGKDLAPSRAGRLCGAFCELRGDWMYLKDILGLPNWWQCAKICHLCNAQKAPGPTYYGDHFGANAALQLVGHAPNAPDGWTAREPLTPLAGIPGFSIWRCMFDLMHTLELGLLMRVIPAALQGLMGLQPGKARVPAEEAVWPGSTRLARCKAATLAWREWARANAPSSARVKRITERWVTGEQPSISQDHAKGAALRAMLPWVAEVAQQRAGPGATEMQGLRARCLSELVALDQLYACKGRFLQRSEEQAAMAHCEAALQALRQMVQLQPQGPWCLIPKAHALWHIAHHSAMGNPRVSHCYQDEDFIGRVKGIYTGCHGKTAPLRTVQRYCMGTALALTAREELVTGKRKAKPPRLQGGAQRGASSGTACSRRSASSSESSSGSALPSGPAGAAERGRGAPSGKRGRGRPAMHKVKRPRGRPSSRGTR